MDFSRCFHQNFLKSLLSTFRGHWTLNHGGLCDECYYSLVGHFPCCTSDFAEGAKREGGRWVKWVTSIEDSEQSYNLSEMSLWDFAMSMLSHNEGSLVNHYLTQLGFHTLNLTRTQETRTAWTLEGVSHLQGMHMESQVQVKRHGGTLI